MGCVLESRLHHRRADLGQEAVGFVAWVADGWMMEPEKEERAVFEWIADDGVCNLFGFAKAQIPRNGVPNASPPCHDHIGTTFVKGGLERLDMDRFPKVFVMLFSRVLPLDFLQEVREDDGIETTDALIRCGSPAEDRIDERCKGLFPFAAIIAVKIVIDHLLCPTRAIGMGRCLAAIVTTIAAVVRCADNHDAL